MAIDKAVLEEKLRLLKTRRDVLMRAADEHQRIVNEHQAALNQLAAESLKLDGEERVLTELINGMQNA